MHGWLAPATPLPRLPGDRSPARTGRFYFLTTVHTSGRPHTRPVLAVWAGGALCTTTTGAAQKGRNLRSDPRCSVAVMGEDMHIVLEGTASPVHAEAMLPYTPCRITPTVVYGWGTSDIVGPRHTRWSFSDDTT